ncbi:MAG TPA: universal stress protein [Opitutaceae bacterium]|nr:universal stress protein [Opitutaceae bacterium]
MKTILVPLDFSAISEEAVDTAISLAADIHAQVVLLHVIHEELVYNGLGVTLAQYAEVSKTVETKTDEALAPFLRRAAERGVHALPHRMQGMPVSRILDEARQLDASFIVMGSHGHGALYELFIGSTALGVLKNAPCPLILVPPNSAHAKAGAPEAEQSVSAK